MLWANVLHIYQPPTQDPDIIHRVVKESYGPLVDGLAKTPNARITLNICATLTEWLVELGYIRVIGEIGEAAKRGQIEFLASAKYHPILPLIPSSEARRQILLNTETNRRYFGPIYNPIGVFLPEMAYSREVGELVAGMGYKYLVMDEIGYAEKFPPEADQPLAEKVKDQDSQGLVQYDKKPVSDRLYQLSGYPDFTIFFRNRRASDVISFSKIKTAEGLLRGMLAKTLAGDQYLVSAVDGETFGHHRKKFDQVLFDAYRLLSNLNIQPMLLGQLLQYNYKSYARVLPLASPKIHPQGDPDFGAPRLASPVPPYINQVDPVACSWSSQPQELARGIPYALWDHPENPVHKWQWRLARLAWQEIKDQPFGSAQGKRSKIKTKEEKNKYDEARNLLDQALHSDQFWWASGYEMKEIKKVFWSREMIDRGARLLLDVIAAIPGVSTETLALARDMYLAIGESAEAFESQVVLQKRNLTG